MTSRTTDVTCCVAAADLDVWTARQWTDGVQVETLQPLDALLVRTRNTTYEVTVLVPHLGEVIVSGGRFFIHPTRARIGGASLGGSFLKLRGVYIGFCLELHGDDGQWIVTTPVQSIEAAPKSPVH